MTQAELTAKLISLRREAERHRLNWQLATFRADIEYHHEEVTGQQYPIKREPPPELDKNIDVTG